MVLVEIAIEPRRKADAELLPLALRRLCERDAALQATTDSESGQTILGGESEAQLNAAVVALTQDFNLAIDVGALQVAYRETISKAIEHDYTHKRQSRGSGEFARLKLRFEPLPAGSGYVFEYAVVGGVVPKDYVPGVEKGLDASRNSGVIAGFPVIDFKATLIDGAYHDLDSSAPAFEIAARACFREAIAKAGPKLLEPIMKVEVVTPDDYLGDVIGNLNGRRGEINGVEALAGQTQFRRIRATAPLSHLFGFPTWLTIATKNLGTFAMMFDRFEAVPNFEPDPHRPGAAAVGIP